MWRSERLEICGLPEHMTDFNTNCPSGWQLTSYSKRTWGKVSTVISPVTQSSYLSDEETTLVSVGGGDCTSVCCSLTAYITVLKDFRPIMIEK